LIAPIVFETSVAWNGGRYARKAQIESLDLQEIYQHDAGSFVVIFPVQLLTFEKVGAVSAFETASILPNISYLTLS